MRKLTGDQVVAIRSADYSERGSAARLAKRMGINSGHLCLVRHRKIWKHKPVVLRAA